MPAFQTPSIAQQRIILAVFLALIGVMAWRQNAGDRAAYPVQKFSQAPVPEVFAALDFTSAEAAWSGLTIDSQGQLQIDALTESALVDAIALMQAQPSEPAMERMAFLLEKQFGALASHQIMTLLPKLQRYKEAEQHWWEEHGSEDSPPHTELFQLQDDLLGKTLAKKMFSAQRRLLATMLATQQIRNDTNLTPAEKHEALLKLQKASQAEDAALE